MDLFSSFDPGVKILGVWLSVGWASAMIPVVTIPQAFWVAKGQPFQSLEALRRALCAELAAVMGPSVAPGSALLFVSIFTCVLVFNGGGLLPYVFTPSSHLAVTLALSMPLWLGHMVFAITANFSSTMAHLVPSGTPAGLMPVMVLIESISTVIRPATLAVRLGANMVAGHLLLALMGGLGPKVGLVGQGAIIVGVATLLVLECAVACIQAYVFTILGALYLSEVSTTEFSQQLTR